MSLGLAFWIILLVWVVFSGVQAYGGQWQTFPFVLLLLLILLGWAVFGAPIKG